MKQGNLSKAHGEQRNALITEARDGAFFIILQEASFFSLTNARAVRISACVHSACTSLRFTADMPTLCLHGLKKAAYSERLNRYNAENLVPSMINGR